MRYLPGSFWTAILAVSLGFTGGCARFGPSQIAASHARYNQALSVNKQEELLLNLVRLRYRDAPYFLDVASLTASFRMEANVGIEADAPLGGAADVLNPSGAVRYSAAPTISFSPVSGPDYLRNFMTPVMPEALRALTQGKHPRLLNFVIDLLPNILTSSNSSSQGPHSQ